METLLSGILIVGFIALVISIVLKKYDIPPLIGFILTGAIVGMIFDLSSNSSHILSEIAELGIVFLMFTIGLEMDINTLISIRRQVFVFGLLQVFISIFIFFIISKFIFSLSVTTSIIIASSLAMSSTAIVLNMLNENNQISSPYGKKVLGILLFQDIAVIPILMMITFLTSNSDISSMLFKVFYSAVGLIVLLYFLGKYVIDKLLKIVVSIKSEELFILAILLITLGTSFLAHSFGFTYSLGAFLGGILIAETHYKHQVEADLIPFRDLLMGIFFISVGMHININFLIENIFYIILLAIFIMFIKALIIYVMLKFFTNKLTALQSAFTISQVGEFSFVIFQIASTYHLLDSNISQTLTLSVIISMVATPFIVKNLDEILYFILKRHTIFCNEKIDTSSLNNHVIVAGYGSFARKIIQRLKEQDIKYIILIDNYELFQQAISNNELAIFGNIDNTSILFKAQVDRAKVFIIALHDINHIKRISYSVKDLNEDIKIVAKVTDKKYLDNIDTTYILDMYEYGANNMVDFTINILKPKKGY